MKSKALVCASPKVFFGYLLPILALMGGPLSDAQAALKAQDLAAAKSVYDLHCAACHGSNGDGQGPATVWLFPKPRNFQNGLFKIQSTPPGFLPTDQDLYQVVTRGLPGSSMPGFSYLVEKDRRLGVEYVKHLSTEMTVDGRRVNRFEEAARTGKTGTPVVVPPEPVLTFDTITRGRDAYQRLQCAACHGETGVGDGPSAPTLKDALGIPVTPRDFNNGAFRGGSDGADLFLRIANGLAGTPMPAFGDDLLKADERWALVHYIQSLRRKDAEINDMLTPEDDTLKVHRVKGSIPTDPVSIEWERMESVRIPLNPLWPEPLSLPAVAVRAVHDGKRIAILLQWRDTIADGAPVRVQDFQDAAALQFSTTGSTPFLGMGDSQNPVNIWQWKAGWQEIVDGRRQDVDSTYPAMHVDVYPDAPMHLLYRTAESAGNLLAKTEIKSPIEDATARGFGTMTTQPPKEQNVGGRGLWRAGSWNVIYMRDLRSRDPNDAVFSPGKSVPVAFAIWNGAQRDRNGRKVVSNWYQLSIE